MTRLILPIVIVALSLPTAAQTMFQTLPAGYEQVEGNSSTSFPVNTANDQVWQWHYDSSEFATQHPITITDIAIRPKQGQLINAWNINSFEVTLIEARTDWANGSHHPDFAQNVIRSAVVRTGGWTGGPLIPLPFGTTGGHVSLGMTTGFTYDPSLGNDFIVQIRSCGVTLAWGTSLDGVSGANATRYGDTGNCLAQVSSFSNANFVPVVRLAYKNAHQTLPAGFDDVDGNGSVGFPVTTVSDQKWQWHYDASEFEVQGPIAIREMYVRARVPTVDLDPFHFSDFKVTLGPASTDYAAHDPEFAANIEGQRIVRSGAWSSGPVPASGGTVATWVPLGLTESFVYDPSGGKDLIVQIEKCGTITPWSTTMDGIFETAGAGGGRRYGHSSDCSALFENSAPANDFVPIVRIDFEPLTSTEGCIVDFPYRETFDGLPSGTALPQGWHNCGGESPDGPADWIVASGATPSINTGPNVDHTSGAGNYVYVEDSLSDNLAVAMLSPVFDLSQLTNPHVSFWLHSQLAPGGVMNDVSMGVYVMPDGPFIQVLGPPPGLTGAFWAEQTYSLNAFAGEKVRLRFSVNNDNGTFSHDIAIDDVRVYDPTIQVGQPPTVFAELDAAGALDPNGLPVTPGLPGPYTAKVFYGEELGLSVSGVANQAFVLFSGPLSVGTDTLPGIGQVDLGLPLIVIVDGVTGMGLLPGVFTTGASGTFVFPGPNVVPPGFTIPLQAVLFTGGPSVIALSNALVVETM